MTAIPFPLTTSPGLNPQEAQGRLINCYAEPSGDSALWRRVPGLTQYGTTTFTGFRGMQGIPGALYAGFANEIVKFTGPGAGAIVGSVPGTKHIIWARNNAAPNPDVVAVDIDNGAYVVTNAVGVKNYPDPDVGQPNSVCFTDGYLFFTRGDGTCIASGLNTTDINALDFITAESNPDGLLRAIPFGSYLLLMGPNSTEFWSGASPNPTGFPFNKVVAIPHGLGARFSVSGWENGFGDALLWVGTDNKVKLLQSGYVPEDVSPPDLDRLIEQITDRDTLEGACYSVGGRQMYVLSSATWTWEFNIDAKKWNERASLNQTRWRGTQSHYYGGQWLVGDTQSGNINALATSAQDEVGATLRTRLESQPVAKFPNLIDVARADFDATTGVGIATGTQNQASPTVEISWSDDGGWNWGNPVLRSLGMQGKDAGRLTVLRAGTTSTKGRRWRIDVADPVPVCIHGGDMAAQLRTR